MTASRPTMMLLFHVGDSRYAIPATEVIEVAPRVKLDPLARVPACIAGLFNYRGRHVPVIDLCKLFNDARCSDSFTSRMILVQFPLAQGKTAPLALLAERVTETAALDEHSFTATGVAVQEAPYLGPATRSEAGLVQRVSVAQLLPENIHSILFPPEAG